jgi:hypothetical protein
VHAFPCDGMIGELGVLAPLAHGESVSLPGRDESIHRLVVAPTLYFCFARLTKSFV